MKIRLFILLIAVFLISCAAYCSIREEKRAAMEQSDGEPRFVIDPGHGGEDGGAVSADGQRESVINLGIGLRMDRLMGLLGYPCTLSRTDESLEYPSNANTVRSRKQADLERRVKLAESTPHAVLISIHQNNYPASGPHGAQIFYREDADSIRLASILQKHFTAGLGDTVRPAVPISDSIFLMRMIKCPGILVECGFLSNPEESMLLRSEGYQTRLALCLACACVEYAEEWEREDGQGKG